MTPWIERCLASVESWARANDYQYAFMGDELLALVPDWYRAKVGERLPIVTDLARLNWIEQTLEGGVEQVVWLDADTLIFKPEALMVEINESCVFGRESWLQEKGGKPQVYRNVHNAYLGFRAGCPVLPFLRYATERMIRRVDQAYLAPQFVGPKLITHLHNLLGFQVDDRFGAVSPLLAQLLVSGSPEAAGYLRGVSAANLCLSLAHEMDHYSLLDALLEVQG